jgi:hypothetical protein
MVRLAVAKFLFLAVLLLVGALCTGAAAQVLWWLARAGWLLGSVVALGFIVLVAWAVVVASLFNVARSVLDFD